MICINIPEFNAEQFKLYAAMGGIILVIAFTFRIQIISFLLSIFAFMFLVVAIIGAYIVWQKTKKEE